MTIPIWKIWLTQRHLDIRRLVAAISHNDYTEKIELRRCEDGQIELVNGHHRLMAMWAKGRRELNPWEYVMVESDKSVPRCCCLGV